MHHHAPHPNRRPRCAAAQALLLAALLLAACSDESSEESGPTGGFIDPDAEMDSTASGQEDTGAAPDTAAPDTAVVDSASPEDTAAPDAAEDTAAEDTTPDAPDAVGLPESWASRSCDVTLRFEGAAQRVAVAGAFNGWDTEATPMSAANGGFEVRLTEADGLTQGELHPYKLVLNGSEWILDPRNTHQKYEGDCVNSALRFPRCDAPLVQVEPAEATLSGESGAATLRGQVMANAAGVAVAEVTFTLNGAPLPEGAARFEADGEGAFTVELDDLAPGRYVLGVRAEDADGNLAEPVDAVFWVEAEPFDYRDSVLYMLFIDRFANGEVGNDDPEEGPVDRAADWHGGDLQGALEVMRTGYFEELGVKAIWLSPINAQVAGHFAERGGGDKRIAPYHGYWPIEPREVEPRFGGNDALKALVEEAHRRGIRILLDLINNQVHEEHVYVDAHPDWFRTDCICGIDPGCGWSERPLDCLFAPYLPDINWRVPGAEAQFIADAIYWVEEFGVDGFRVDAVKHVETTSIYNLRAALAQRFEQGGERIVMLGETAVGESDRAPGSCGAQAFDSGYAWIEGYTGPQALDGQFDFPTHHRMQWGLLTNTMGYDALEPILSDMERLYNDDALHVRFLGSHDSSRIASRAAQDPGRDCQWADRCDAPMPATVTSPEVYDTLKRAWTLLWTMPGIPLLYNGDEIALPGGNDPDGRRDMLWTEDLSPLAMTATAPTAAQEDLREWLRELARARRLNPALTRGERVPLLATADLYVFARRLAGESTALVVLNRGGEVQGQTIDLGQLGVTGLVPIVGNASASINGGSLSLSIPARGAAVLVEP